MFKVFCVSLLLVGSFSFARTAPSAHRPDQESWVVSKQKIQLQEAFQFKTERAKDSAMESSVAYDKVDLNQIPEFQKSADEIQKMFEDIRNIRFLEDPDVTQFPRRISWLYPMDGCFIRAEWVAHLLRKNDPTVQFSRVFIFGNLKVKTKNSSSGSVSWWYHVAVIIRHQGKAFVFDPSLEVTRPLELSDWVKLQVPNPSKDAELAICTDATYSPSDDCDSKKLLSEKEAADDISDYLSYERSNLTRLKRDPQVELGDNPPW